MLWWMLWLQAGPGYLIELDPSNSLSKQQPALWLAMQPLEGLSDHLAHVYLLPPADGDPESTINSLRHLPGVKSVQLNYAYQADQIPNDPRYGEQWAHQAMQLESTWDIQTQSLFPIAVIGTGVNIDHPDLKNNLWSNPAEVLNGKDDDGNGKIDDLHGWNFSSNTGQFLDESNHETGVAGVILAQGNNAIGVAGVCWRGQLMTLQVDYTSAQVAAAIHYAIDQGARVINMSFGSYDPGKYGPDSIVETALARAEANGVVCVATAGNETLNQQRFPAALPSVLAIGASAAGPARAEFSNWGPWIDLAAPGAAILSTNASGDFQIFFGTSFAAPYVSGVAALLQSRHPDLSPADIRHCLIAASEPVEFDRPIGGYLNPSTAINQPTPSAFARILDPWPHKVQLGDELPVLAMVHGQIQRLSLQMEGNEEQIDLPFQQIEDWQRDVIAHIETATLEPNQAYQLTLQVLWEGSLAQHVVTFSTACSQLEAEPLGFGALVCPPTLAVRADGSPFWTQGSNSGSILVRNDQGENLAGWPQKLAQPYLFGAPAVANLDDDPEPELVFTAYGFGGTGLVSVLGLDGQVRWQKQVGQVRGSALLVDLNGNGHLEVVAQDRQRLYAWTASGTMLAGFPVTFSGFGPDNSPAAGDLDGDGQPELVVSSANALVVVDQHGTIRFERPIGIGTTSPLLVDLDGDGALEILVRSYRSLYALNGQGQVVWASALARPAVYAGMAVGRYGPASDLAIAVSLGGTDLTHSEPSLFQVFDGSGVAQDGYPVLLAGEATHEPLLLDVDGDGHNEWVIGDRQGQIHAISALGQLIEGFPVFVAGRIANSGGAGLWQGGSGLFFPGEEGESFRLTLPIPFDSNDGWPESRGDLARTGAHASHLPSSASLFPLQVIPHVTQDNGLFRSSLVLKNMQDQVATMSLIGLDREGQVLESVPLTLGPAERVERPITQLFETPVSHIQIQTKVMIQAQCLVTRLATAETVKIPMTDIPFSRFAYFGLGETQLLGIVLVNLSQEAGSVQAKWEQGGIYQTAWEGEIPAFGKRLVVLPSPGSGIGLYLEGEMPMDALVLGFTDTQMKVFSPFSKE
ncbi:MAG: S8 family serine peptidase [Acidobacteria bacterium]|nr:S8 family serine peptidase [Acidobacteriota bacterium]